MDEFLKIGCGNQKGLQELEGQDQYSNMNNKGSLHAIF